MSDGQAAKPVLQLMASKYLSEAYAPEAVAERVRHPAEKIRASPPRSRAWPSRRRSFSTALDRFPRREARQDDRAARQMHAMRGISAHSNGFQTCRALHVLQILLGSVEVPRRASASSRPTPSRCRASQAACRSRPDAARAARIWAIVQGPEDLLLARTARPRHRQGVHLGQPDVAHGLMHMVISNAHAGDPYKIDTLFLYMANMAWNSSMNTRGVMRC
jgi:anaerobic selenocysteine-containing dehydrogenase